MKLSHEEDADDKLALLREVAGLYEGRVKEPAKAFERYLSAFEIAPHDEQSAADVERAAKATGKAGTTSSRRTTRRSTTADDDGRSRARRSCFA